MNIWMIVVSGDPASDYYADICIDQWNKLGYNIEKKEGTTPETLGDELNFLPRKWTGNYFTPSEKAIWYSHYNLWKQVKEPTCIIEHDTYPYKKLPKFEKDWGLFSTFPRNDQAWLRTREAISPGSGYYLNRTSASILRDYAHRLPLNANVDDHIHQTAREFLKMNNEQFEEYCRSKLSCFQIVNYDVGTTARHNGE
jgi:hypothetical protein